MADKIFSHTFNDDIGYITKRFSCSCLFPGHILDVTIETADKGKRFVDCTFNLYMDGKAPLKFRLKQMWKLLLGGEGSLADFILRPEDAGEMIEILSKIPSKKE